METLKYKIIKSKKQYLTYCKILEDLLFAPKSKDIEDEIELLTLLIEKWDIEQNAAPEMDPIELLHALMNGRNMKPKDLVGLLNMSKGYVSDILNYKKGLSKEVIRSLASYFKVNQEAFNRPYKLVVTENSHLRNASVMNTKKELSFV